MKTNNLYYGDCLDVLKNSTEDESIDLIYIDPPFNSKRNYNVLFESIDMTNTKAQKEAFADTWSNIKYVDQLVEIQGVHLDLYKFLKLLDSIDVSKGVVSYLVTMSLRIFYMHHKLKPTGSFYLHCDPTMSHYLKIVCDIIFGKMCFRNEIIWHYRRWSAATSNFQRMHDTIFWYSKSMKEWTFTQPLQPYSHPEMIEDTMRGFVDGKLQRLRNSDGSYVKREKENKGVMMHDVWEDINFIPPTAKERIGYSTQKPEALLERIIKASSNEGDVVADFFCGCGTAIAVAQNLNRRWIGVDISHLAVRLVYNRLLDPYRDAPDKLLMIKSDIGLNGFPRDIDSAHELAEDTISHTNRRGLKFQDWVIEFMLDGVSNPKKVGDGGYDGYLTLTRGAKSKDVILVEVKSGNVGVKNIREFKEVVEHENAAMGIFVCFEDHVTKPMLLRALEADYYEKDSFGNKFPRIQILTIEDLLKGMPILHPSSAMANTTFRKATK